MTPFELSQLSPAEALLWNYGISDPVDIDLDAIAFDMGATVHRRPLCGCEARLVADGDKAVITINSKSIITRQRFSLAHELGHLKLDRGRSGFLCTSKDIGPHSDASRDGEAIANSFASQLLLPSYLFIPAACGKPLTIDSAQKLGATFNASITATCIKMVRTSTAPAWVVCHVRRGLAWFFKSPKAPENLFLNRELHYDTEAFDLVYGEGEGKTRIKTEGGQLWFSDREASRYQVKSQSFRVQDGTVVSLLSLSK
ncbi:ImmA/IrrE family metallo-endopeptidase [Janthinobacterium sp. LB3P112]|uniref:ImmA/IrrE family metallo-endopeptidase n=1 Tax=Janthinobacterium sp. LB3P112 TaxID=3424196 RepID=UPI003F234554